MVKPVKSMKCYISKELPPLHLLFTEEDNVIVVRCLDFSISSHGETVEDALESINSSLVDYIKYSMENSDIDNLFDHDLKDYWDMYRELETKQEIESFKEHFNKVEKRFLDEGLIYA